MNIALNKLVVAAVLLEKSALRKSLTGVASVEVVLEHRSTQIECQTRRQVQCLLPAVALGAVAEELARCSEGVMYEFSGFLDKKSLKSPKLIMHITHFKPS